MDDLFGRLLTRRAVLELAGFGSLAVKTGTALPGAQALPLDDALAVWEMGGTSSRQNRRRFTGNGDVRTGIPLGKEEIPACRERGAAPFAALFNGGWLKDAGPAWSAGRGAITYAVRLKNPSNEWSTPIFGVSGGRTRESFFLYAADSDELAGMALIAEIGNDAVRGFHRVRMSAGLAAGDSWHDIVVRFDGEKLELFLDGALRDSEVATGTVRLNPSQPCLIGAGAPNEDGRLRADYQGLINYAAVWSRALRDEEIARLSGARALRDERPVYYHEKYRPQFHFSARKHWINDPNGLVYYKGMYHMFFQHMPPGRTGTYKQWGHALSRDLVHWNEVGAPITPHKDWGGCWSGSAVVDWHNTAGFETGPEKTMVAILTNGGEPEAGPPCTQCIAYSNDAGATFKYFDGNPVLPHIVNSNRDPKVIWHVPTRKWVMALYLDGNEYGFFGSSDLKNWRKLSTIQFPDTIECPDLFELPVDGDRSRTKWVLWGASGGHMIGHFDGTVFHPETGVLTGDYGNSFYAAQSWSDMDPADGRRIQIAWLRRGDYPGMPFTQQMNFPTEVTLRTTPDGIRVHRMPVRELRMLRAPGRQWSDVDLNPGKNLFGGVDGELLEINLTAALRSTTGGARLSIRGADIVFDAAQRTLTLFGRSAPASAERGQISLTILVDRTSIEVFFNSGRLVMSSCFLPADDDRELRLEAFGAPLRVLTAEVNPLRSIWS